MSQKFLVDEKTVASLIRLTAFAGELMERQGREGHAEQGASGDSAPEPRADREESPEASRVRPASQRPGHEPSAGEGASAPGAAPSPAVPELTVWRRAVALPASRAGEDLREVVRWLEAELAAKRAEEDASAVPRRAAGLPSPGAPPPEPGEQAQGGPEDRASGPVRECARRLSRRTPKDVRPLLLTIAERYFVPAYGVTAMRHEAGTTEWQGKMFQKELGHSPMGAIQGCRLWTALRLLRDTSLSVEEVARRVGLETEGALRKLFRRTCGFSPSQARRYLRRVEPEHRARCEELLSWYFWVRHHRGELTAEDFRAALDYLERRFGPPEA